MAREQWKNLSHNFRWMRRLTSHREAVAWIASIRRPYFNVSEVMVLERVYGRVSGERSKL